MLTKDPQSSPRHKQIPSRTQRPFMDGDKRTGQDDRPDRLWRQRYLGNHACENLAENDPPDALPRVSARSSDFRRDGLELASILGNRAVGRLLLEDLRGEPPVHRRSTVLTSVLSQRGHPLDPATRTVMESRFGHDFGPVRLHTDATAAESARSVHARAYTIGHSVVFGQGRYAPGTDSGHRLLAHELAHVVQQEHGGPAPEPDPGAAQEREASAVGKTAIGGAGGPVAITAATGVGLARSVDDWLGGTPDFTRWSYSRLVEEIDEIQAWMDRQIETSPDVRRLEDALDELRTELAKRQSSAFQAPKKKARGGRRRRGRRRDKRRRQRDDTPTVTERVTRMPRILLEGTSIAYSDDDEIRAQVDLIMAWLRRKDLTPDQRDILQTELLNLAPGFQESRVRKATERRAAGIQRALTPKVSTDARDQLVETVKLIDGIRPMTGRPGYSALMHGNEMIVLTDAEADYIRKGVLKMMDATVRKIAGINRDAFEKWSYQAKVNREELFAGFVVGLKTENDASDILDKMKVFSGKTDDFLLRYRGARRRGNLVQMARAIGNAEENALKAKLVVDKWVGDVITAAGEIVSDLEFTRDLSFTIVTSYFGGAGFASLARGGVGLVRAGLTVTAVGAGSNALARGGGNLAGQAFAGGPIDVAEAGQETIAGANRGGVDALAGAVTAGTGAVLGEATTTTGRIAHGALAGTAGGAAGGGAQAALEGKSAPEIIKSAGKGGLSGAIGGAIGGATSGALSSQSGATRSIVGSAGGAAGDAIATWATGGSAEDIKRAATIGLFTGGITAAATPETHPGSPRRRARQKKPTAGEAISPQKGAGRRPAIEAHPAPEPAGGLRPSGFDDETTNVFRRQPRERAARSETAPEHGKPVPMEMVPEVPLPEATVIKLPRPEKITGAYVRDVYETYRKMMADDPTREAGLYHNPVSGDFILVQGNENAVIVSTQGLQYPLKGGRWQKWKEILDKGEDVGRWELVRHSHPSPPGSEYVADVNRLPSGAVKDMDVIYFESVRGDGKARTSTIDYLTPDGPDHTTFGFNPDHDMPFWVDFPAPQTGARTIRRFADLESYHAWVQRTFNFDPGPVPPGHVPGETPPQAGSQSGSSPNVPASQSSGEPPGPPVRSLDRNQALGHHLKMDQGVRETETSRRIIRVPAELYDAAWQRSGQSGPPPRYGFEDDARGQIVLPDTRRPDILDPGGRLQRGANDPRHYFAREHFGETTSLGGADARYFAEAHLRTGDIVDLDFRLRIPAEVGMRRSSRLRGQEEFNNALTHFRRQRLDVKGIRGDWDQGDNLQRFNERFTEHLRDNLSWDEAFRQAALETHTGGWAAAAGFSDVRTETAAFNPDTMRFDHVMVVFERGAGPRPVDATGRIGRWIAEDIEGLAQPGSAPLDPRRLRPTVDLTLSPQAQARARQTWQDQLLPVARRQGGVIPRVDVERVEFHDVAVSKRGDELQVGYFGIHRRTAPRGAAPEMQEALEKAAFQVARQVGAKSVRIYVKKVTNPRWRALLLARGYTNYPRPHAHGVEYVLAKRFPIPERMIRIDDDRPR